MTQEPTIQNESVEVEAKPAGLAATGLPIIEDVELDSLVGRGAFSLVYSGRQRMLDRKVAVKILSASTHSDDSTLARFKQEAKLTSRLSHPNIIKVLSYGVADSGAPYLVMEYAEGKTLEAELQEKRTSSLLQFRQIFIPILSALSYAHEHKIVHRDIKPANIVISSNADGSILPKLLDLGLAKTFENADDSQHRTKTGIFVGTPAYMSPEQCSGAEVDGRSDLYSLACVMYEYLHAEPPFSGGSALEIMSKQIQSAPASIPQFCDETGVGPKLAANILSALEKDPSKRPQSAEEFSSSLLASLRDTDLTNTFLKGQKSSTSKPDSKAVFLCILIGLIASGFLLFAVLPKSQNRRIVRSSAKRIVKTDELIPRTSRNSELAEIEKFKNGNDQQRLEAFFRLLKIIPDLEAREGIHRKDLGKAYIDAATLINGFGPTQIGPYSPDQLNEMVIDFSNKGCAIALLTSNAEWFSLNCNNLFFRLVEQKNGTEMIESRVAQARKQWPLSNRTFEIHKLAIEYLIKEKKLKAAERVLKKASEYASPGQVDPWSIWIDAMSANLAAHADQPRKAKQLLSSVLKDFDSQSVLSPKSRKEIMESALHPSFQALNESKKFAAFADREFQKNIVMYESMGESSVGSLCELICSAYRESNEPERSIYYYEKAIEYFEQAEEQKYMLATRYKSFIDELSKMGPKYHASLAKYRLKLKKFELEHHSLTS